MSEVLIIPESSLRRQLFDYLTKYSDDLVVEMWKGWWIKAGGQKQQHPFHREFDIAVFKKTEYHLTLTGYEIKGTRKRGTQVFPPPFGAGLDQALTLLLQGADYSYLVTPGLSDQWTERDFATPLAELCHQFTMVGLIFPSLDKDRQTVTSWHTRVEAKQNTHTQEETKKRMLTCLLTSGQNGRIRVPNWAKEFTK
jgi:hypothetical protein